jgi:hypothetical protein
MVFGIIALVIAIGSLVISIINFNKKGIIGPQGPQGKTGPAGKNGTSINIIGTLISESKLPTNGNVDGDAYIIDGDLFVWYDSNKEILGSSINTQNVCYYDNNTKTVEYCDYDTCAGNRPFDSVEDIYNLEKNDKFVVECQIDTTFCTNDYCPDCPTNAFDEIVPKGKWKNVGRIQGPAGKDGIVTTLNIENIPFIQIEENKLIIKGKVIAEEGFFQDNG